MTISFPFVTGGGEFVWPVIVDGIFTPSFFGAANVADTFYSALGWAIPIRAPENMNVDAIAYITGGTAWSGRKVGLFDIDTTGFDLGAELASVTSLAPAANTEVVSTFTPIALVKDRVYWIAAGGGTGTTKCFDYATAISNGFYDELLVNTVGSLTLDVIASTAAQSAVSRSLQVSANTPAALGALIDPSSANAVAMPICGLRKSA